MEQGLYKYDGELMYAAISVNYPDGTIIKSADYAEQQEVADGWWWFKSRAAACEHFGIEFNQNQIN